MMTVRPQSTPQFPNLGITAPLCDREAWMNWSHSRDAEVGSRVGIWSQLQSRCLAADINGQIFRVSLRESLMSSSQAIDSLRRRGVEMLFHPGTHDMVVTICSGAVHTIHKPIILEPTRHGKRGHPKLERDQSNKAAFLLQHFFPEQMSVRPPPSTKS